MIKPDVDGLTELSRSSLAPVEGPRHPNNALVFRGLTRHQSTCKANLSSSSKLSNSHSGVR